MSNSSTEIVVCVKHDNVYEFIRDMHLHDVAHEYRRFATFDDVRGREVWGFVPLNLAAAAKRVVVVPFVPHPRDIDKMKFDDLARLAREPVVYTVKRHESRTLDV